MPKMRDKYRKNFIREIREKNKIALEKLADMVGLTNQQVSNIELGKSRLSTDQLYKFAEALQCSPYDILDGIGVSPLPKNEAQKKVLHALSKLSEKDQEMYAAGFLSGLPMQKDDATPKNDTEKKSRG